MLDKSLYNTVLCQAFSPCSKYLIAGNIYGQIAIFDLNHILNPSEEPLGVDYNKPKKIHSIVHDVQICSLVSSEKFLIVGTVGEITGWQWKAILGTKQNKPSWVIRIPSKNTAVDQVDINSLWLSDDEQKLYAGCGDNNVYAFNLEDGRPENTFEGHTDYVHCVHGRAQQIISASEDGSVKLWDPRSSKAQSTIKPYTNSNVARADLGKWVGAASLGEDWIVCGGGPRLALWHLRSLDAYTVFNLPDHGIHVATFNEEYVLAAGAAKHLYQLSYSGEVKVELPVSATTVYSAVWRTSPNKVLAVAGSSSEIDLCTTFKYRDEVLYFR